jgi:peptide/nickel transport system substrate-binding protein
MKKKLAILLALCMVFVLVAACNGDSDTGTSGGGDTTAGGGGATGTTGGGGANVATEDPEVDDTGRVISAKDTVTMAIMQDRGTLDPLYLVGWDNQQAMRLVYEPLWEYDETNTFIKWVLATSIDDTDPLAWIITLRDDVYFSNGNKFTARDVLFSLWLANNRVGEPPYFRHMDNDANRAIDDYTVEIIFTEYRVGLEFTFATIFMYNEETYDFDTVAMQAMGSGPYILTDYVIGSHKNFELRDDYWGVLPPIRYVNFRVLIEEAQRVNALQTGEVDIARVPFQDIDFVRSLPHMNVRLANARSQRSLFVNASHPDSPFFDNLDARKAIFYAVDPQGILDVVYSGFGMISRGPYTQHVPNPNEADFDLGIYGNFYQPEYARELAISSGLVDWPYPIRFINNGAPDMVMVAELTQAYLRDIGITVDILSLDPGSWLAYRFDSSTFDMLVDFTGSATAAGDLAVWWLYAGNFPNDYGDEYPWYPPELERMRYLGDMVMGVTDPAEVARIVTEMNQYLIDQYYVVNYVDMVTAQARHVDLVVDMSGGWIDWMTLYWAR